MGAARDWAFTGYEGEWLLLSRGCILRAGVLDAEPDLIHPIVRGMSNSLARPASLLLVVVVAAACASSSGSVAGASANGDMSAGGCALRPQDSTFAASGPVYRDCAVSSKAYLLTTDIHPDFQASRAAMKSGVCAVAEVDYVVGADGYVEARTAHIVKTNNPTYADAVVAILPQWRFEPAKLDGVPVRQIISAKEWIQGGVVVMPAGQKPSPSARAPRTTPSC